MNALKIGLTVAFLTASPLAAMAQQANAGGSVDEFAKTATQSSLTEVLMSAMALQKTSDMRVSEHAWTMLDHHSRAIGDLADVLDADDAALPSEPSAEQTAMLDEMRALDGQAFDTAYLEHQVEAHESSIQNFQTGTELSEEMVANYAKATLPILRAHLEIAQMRQEQEPMPMQGQ